MDRLAALLKHFTVSAQMFHSGPLCGINDFEPQKGLGQLHLLRKGSLQISHRKGKNYTVEKPSLLFYPRPFYHRFISDKKIGAEMACAHIQFNHSTSNPLVQSLPEFLLLPLDELQGTNVILDVLFNEAFHPRCGGQVVIDRLFEVIIVHILRWLMDHEEVPTGVLAGMAQPQIARSLVAIHTHPEQAWSLESLAAEANMSRSTYASTFKTILGFTPGDYLSQWRFGLAQQKLRAGAPLKQIAEEVGYGSVEAFSRAFKAHCQLSPREWRQQFES